MNIAIVCDSITHQIGGSFRSALRFAELLSKKGNKIVLIAAKYPGTRGVEVCHGMKIYRFRSIPVPKMQKLVRVCFALTTEIKGIFLKENIQIVHVMIPTPIALISIDAAKSLGLKIVAHSHTQPENVFLHFSANMGSAANVGNEMINSLFYKYLVWVYKKANTVVCPSKFAERLLKNEDPKLITKVISNGVDGAKFKRTDSSSFLRKFGLSKKDNMVLFVGRLHPEKSVETLIKAMPFVLKRFQRVKLCIVGKGYLLKPLQKLVKKLNLGNSIKFLGPVPDEDLILAYNACDIFVLPSLAELEGMVVLEAMSCGKPVIIADSKDSASVNFVNGNGLLFKPKDHGDLSTKLIRLLEDEKLRKKMATKSHKLAKQYDINKSVAELEKLYFALLAPKLRVNS